MVPSSVTEYVVSCKTFGAILTGINRALPYAQFRGGDTYFLGVGALG